MQIGKTKISFTGPEHILYWFTPALIALTFYISRLMGNEAYKQWVMSPMGFTEGIVGGVLLITIIFGLWTFKDPAIRANKVLCGWIALYILAVVFFLGEDQNWGQYYRQLYFDYEVPQYFLNNNKEQETNLHNMSSWFNEKPRILVTIWVFVAGLMVPLGWKWPVEKTKKFVPQVMWADARIIPLAVLALTARWPERLKYVIADFDAKAIRYSEIQEMFIAFFMLMFIAQIYQRAVAAAVVTPKKKSKAKK